MEYAASIVIMIAIFVILAASFNLILGYSGLRSLDRRFFCGIGVYGTSLSVMSYQVPVVLGMMIATAIALLLSILLSLPSLRVSGDYLVIASSGFQVGLLQIIRNMNWTRG